MSVVEIFQFCTKKAEALTISVPYIKSLRMVFINYTFYGNWFLSTSTFINSLRDENRAGCICVGVYDTTLSFYTRGKN